jgi:SAM-dependent methyltransferase
VSRVSSAAEAAERLPSPFEDADLYDAIFHDFDMDLEFWRARARAAGGPVLEVGCGTGRVMLAMAEQGADVDGFDNAAAMIRGLEETAAARSLRVHAVEGDMRDFRMPRRYALIAIPFNAFLHNLTQADQLATLSRCREHLLPGGCLTMHISFFSAAIIQGSPGENSTPVLEHETRHPRTGRTLRLYDQRTMNPVEQIQHSINEIHEVDERGEIVARHRSETRVRWIYKPELELLLKAAGFTRWRIDGGFDGRPLASEEDQMIVFAWAD